MTASAAIEIAQLRKVFRQTTSGQSVVAINDLTLRIEPGQLVAIVGQTGCGKSTLFDLLIGLEHPTAGRITIGGKTPYDDFNAFRGRIATIFQQDRLLPWRSALDNVKLPLELIGIAEEEQQQRAMTWLTRLGLEKFAHAFPRELSGGMRQRVAIARAFAVQPEILLADESFSALDEVTANDLRNTFVGLAREFRSTAILITHQLEEAMAVGDRIVVFGKSAALLADVTMADWDRAEHPQLRTAIQGTLQANAPDPRLARPSMQDGSSDITGTRLQPFR
jgi:NitT/TauT family transport system ATP-binding protein